MPLITIRTTISVMNVPRSILLASLSVSIWAQSTLPAVLSQSDVEQLETQVASNPSDLNAQTVLGRNYAYFILGVTALDKYGTPAEFDYSKANSDFAQRAKSQLTGDIALATVLGEGGQTLWNGSFSIPFLNKDIDKSSAQSVAIKAIDLAVQVQPDKSTWRVYRIYILDFRSKFNVFPLSVEDAFAQVKQDFALLSDFDRPWMISIVGKLAVRASALDEALVYGQSMLDDFNGNKYQWNRGDLSYFGNMVLGQVAIRKSDVDGARQYLIAAGMTSGSPTLNSFGPNMSLAKDLLEAGERDSVLAFFDECRAFWKLGSSKLDQWSVQVLDGKVPDFGANLVY